MFKNVFIVLSAFVLTAFVLTTVLTTGAALAAEERAVPSTKVNTTPRLTTSQVLYIEYNRNLFYLIVIFQIKLNFSFN